MNLGYLLIIAVGVAWTAIAVTVSEGRRRDCPIQQFYLTGSLVALLIVACLIGTEGVRGIFAPEVRRAVWCFFVGSIFNGAGQAVSMGNLRQGGRALAYAIPQQAFVFPYLWSMAFWDQHVSVVSVLGIALIVAAVFYLSVTRNGGGSTSLSPGRILVALLAMALIGISQIVLIAPTRFAAGRTPAPLPGAAVILGANAIFFLIWSLFKARGFARFRLYLPFGAAWGVFAAASHCILLTALGLLGKINQSGIAYPVGAGILILLYSLFTVVRYHEKLNRRQVCAFLVLVCGICCAKLG